MTSTWQGVLNVGMKKSCSLESSIVIAAHVTAQSAVDVTCPAHHVTLMESTAYVVHVVRKNLKVESLHLMERRRKKGFPWSRVMICWMEWQPWREI